MGRDGIEGDERKERKIGENGKRDDKKRSDGLRLMIRIERPNIRSKRNGKEKNRRRLIIEDRDDESRV